MVDLPTRLRHAVARLTCGTEQGTAFFVSERLAITCRHCVVAHLLDASEPIRLTGYSPDAEVTARLAPSEIPISADVVLLELDTPVDQSRVLALKATHLPRGIAWTAYGFRSTSAKAGAVIAGTVVRMVADARTPWDTELQPEPPMSPGQSGMSGAPLVVGEDVRGLIQKELTGTLGAISLVALRAHLEAAGIDVEGNRGNASAPPDLRESLSKSVPNDQTFALIEEATCQASRGYVLVTGGPGAGKTLIAAAYEPVGTESIVVGRYFIGSYEGRELPASYYRQPRVFCEWLSEQASYCSASAVATTATAGPADFAKAFAQNISVIAAHYAAQKTIGLIIVDDVDPASSDSFVALLPEELPNGVVVVFTTRHETPFRQAFPALKLARTVVVVPLTTSDCEQYLETECPSLRHSERLRLASLVEGNPLILAYLAREVGRDSEEGPATNHGAGLTAYYSAVWSRIEADPCAVWIVALLSVLRRPVEMSVVPLLLPGEHLTAYPTAWSSVQPYVRKSVAALYHESFSEFVRARTESLHATIHESVVRFCQQHPESEYAPVGLVFHLLELQDHERVLQACSSEWADQAAAIGAEPDLVLEDIERCLERAGSSGRLLHFVRLVLLRSRMKYRYNTLFAENAYELVSAMTLVGRSHRGVHYLLRGGQFVASPDETVEIIRQLICLGKRGDARELYLKFRTYCWSRGEAGTATHALLRNLLEARVLIPPDEDPAAFIAEMEAIKQNFRKSMDRLPGEDAKLVEKAAFFAPAFANLLWRTGGVPARVFAPEDKPEVRCAEILFTLENLEQWLRTYGVPVERAASVPGETWTIDELNIHFLDAVDRGRVLRSLETLVVDRLLRMRAPRASVVKVLLSAMAAVDLRAKNGVDCDTQSIAKFILYVSVDAYLGTASWEGIAKRTRHSWEDRFLEAAREVGLVRGGALAGSIEQGQVFAALNRTALPHLAFSLAERSKWEDACFIPESVVPIVISEIAELVATVEPASLGDLVEALFAKSNQWGLYSEGYRAALWTLARALQPVPEAHALALRVHRKLLEYVRSSVFNRRERVSTLLGLAVDFARLGDRDTARQVLSDATNASVGPTWYKEGQFALLNNALAVVPAGPEFDTGWRRVLNTLELASGEATFQRYAHHEKLKLVQQVLRSSSVAKGVTLAIHLWLPSYEVQASRIRSVNVDRVDDLVGSRFGAGEIGDRPLALTLLDNINGMSNARRWTLIELNWLGNSRFGLDFARHALPLLVDSTGTIGTRFLQFLRCDAGVQERALLATWLREVGATDAYWCSLAVSLGLLPATQLTTSPPEKKVGRGRVVAVPPEAKPDAEPTEDDMLLPGTFGTREGIDEAKKLAQEAQRLLSNGETLSARSSALRAIEVAQSAGWGVWSYPSDALGLDVLWRSTSPSEFAQSLAPIVMRERYAWDWEIVSTLLSAVSGAGDSALGQSLLQVVEDHIRALLGPEATHAIVVSEEPTSALELPSESDDESVDRFLVASLDHPARQVRHRTAEALRWLLDDSGGEKLLRLLAKRTEVNSLGHGRMLAAGILHGIVRAGGRLSTDDLIAESRAIAESNLFVRSAFSVIKGAPLPAWSGTPPVEVPDLQDYQWQLVKSLTGVWGSDWRLRASPLLAQACGTHRPSDLQRLFDARKNAWMLGRELPAWEEEVFSHAVAHKSVRDVEQFASWNPEWPERHFSHEWAIRAKELRSRYAAKTLAKMVEIDGDCVVHFHDFVVDERGTLSELEVLAVLVDQSYFDGRLVASLVSEAGSSFDTESARATPASVLAQVNQPAAIVYPAMFSAAGWDVTPARPTATLCHALGIESAEFKRASWRDGRKWERYVAGRPLAYGAALAVASASLAQLRGFELAWLIRCDGNQVVVPRPGTTKVAHGD